MSGKKVFRNYMRTPPGWDRGRWGSHLSGVFFVASAACCSLMIWVCLKMVYTCTLPNSHLNREHDDMFFKHIYYILDMLFPLTKQLGASSHQTIRLLFPALPRSIARTLLSLQVDAAGCDLGITGLDLCHYGSRWSGFNWLRALAMKPPFPRSHMAIYIYAYIYIYIYWSDMCTV